MKKYLIFFILVTGCYSDIPDNLISEKKMESIIFDIMSEKKNCIPAENCTGYYQAIAYDLDCIQKHPTVCQVLRCLLLNCF